MKTTTACAALASTRCTRRPTFTPCAGTNAPEGIFGNFGYANLVSLKGWVGTFRPFCDA
jgi:hypothetical protein